jgi:hypothetical protein
MGMLLFWVAVIAFFRVIRLIGNDKPKAELAKRAGLPQVTKLTDREAQAIVQAERDARLNARREREERDRSMRDDERNALTRKANADRTQGAERCIARNGPLIEKFLEVAYRKVSLRDEYGDENWDALDAEVVRVIKKLRKSDAYLEAICASSDAILREQKGRSQRSHLVGEVQDVDVVALLQRHLSIRFKAYHHEQSEKERRPGPDDGAAVAQLSGAEYEAKVIVWLRELGVKEVTGTKSSGDQGADVVFTVKGRRVAVQCKRYKNKIGNGPVQEVHTAKAVYNCTDAWVVTTNEATPGGREAAQKTGVTIVECATTRRPIEEALRALG